MHQTWYRRRALALALAVLTLIGAASFLPGRTAVAQIARCTGQFEATVHLGPDAGLALTGALTFAVDGAGTVTGELVRPDRTVVGVSGQATGRALNLVFDLGERGLIFGVGTGQQPISSCSGIIGGPLVGPRSGDSGDWAVTRQINLEPRSFQPTSFSPGGAVVPAPAGGPSALPRTGTGPQADSRLAMGAALGALASGLLVAGGVALRRRGQPRASSVRPPR